MINKICVRTHLFVYATILMQFLVTHNKLLLSVTKLRELLTCSDALTVQTKQYNYYQHEYSLDT